MRPIWIYNKEPLGNSGALAHSKAQGRINYDNPRCAQRPGTDNLNSVNVTRPI